MSRPARMDILKRDFKLALCLSVGISLLFGIILGFRHRQDKVTVSPPSVTSDSESVNSSGEDIGKDPPSELPEIVIESKEDKTVNPTSYDARVSVLSSDSSPVGEIKTLAVNAITDKGIVRADLTGYSFKYLVFRWKSGDLSWGVGDSRVIPDLVTVVANNEFGSTTTLISELIPLDPVRYLYLQSEAGLTGLEVDLIDPTDNEGFTVTASPSNYSSGPKYSSLNIIPREAWSGDPNINDPRIIADGGRLVWEPFYYRVTKFVIHHTATPNDRDPIEDIRATYLYHRYSMPWYDGVGMGDIGYNYLIDRYGNIYEGKLGGDEAKGYHAGDGNAGSVGIAIMGTYSNSAPSQAAQDALVRLLAEKAAVAGINLTWHSSVYGHRDILPTDCPGNEFYKILPDLTSQAQNYLDGNFSEIKSKVADVNSGINNGDFKGNELIVKFNSPSDLNSFINSQIPIDPNTNLPAFWTGIESYQIGDNDIHFEINYSNETGSYYSIDRLRDLYKIFYLDPRIKSAGLNFRYGI